MSHYITYRKWTFQPDNIRECVIVRATSLISASLEVDTLIAVVDCDDPAIARFRRKDKLYYQDGDAPAIVYHPKSVERIAEQTYRITATSPLGLLCEGRHYGGIYTGQTAGAAIDSICGTIPHTVKTSLSALKLYGWLPIAAPRDNLAQVLFAIGATLRTSAEGALEIDNLSEDIKRAIPQSKIYQECSVARGDPVTSVVVTEHQYIQDFRSEQTLFDGASKNGQIITFSEPMHSLRAENATIADSGANWAKLSGGANVKLYGYPYAHNTREVSKPVAPGAVPNVKTVRDSTLISLVNVEAVSNRLAEYYALTETVNAPVVYQGETPGDQVEIYHPFGGETVGACLQRAEIVVSNTIKAQETLLVGFAPYEDVEEDYYNARQEFRADGEFVVPDGARTIRVVLISGGQGGYNGQKGADGAKGKVGTVGGSGGAGGLQGNGGQGGRIYQVTIRVKPGQRFAAHVGAGGVGHAPVSSGSMPGALGADSTFGDHSSASGEPNPNGYKDIINGGLYATPGPEGSPGKAGGNGGQKGEDFSPFSGGSQGIPYPNAIYPGSKYAQGGGGGGAAWGGNGVKGDNATGRDWGGAGDRYGGKGGTGGTPMAGTNSYARGGGGWGGHGGGGGGGGGAANGANTSVGQVNVPGEGGLGSLGSKGGNGGDGVVIVYYADKTIEGAV